LRQALGSAMADEIERDNKVFLMGSTKTFHFSHNK